MHLKRYHVYLLANRSHTLYVGVTSDLEPRVLQRKLKALPGFTATYDIDRLVRYEVFHDSMSAIGREKQIKGLTRAKKIGLIEAENKNKVDLAKDRFRDPGRAVDERSFAALRMTSVRRQLARLLFRAR